MNIRRIICYTFFIGGLFTQFNLAAQLPKKTIDITSSFKPQWIPQQKMSGNASEYRSDTARPSLSYNIPSKNLNFKFFPSSIRPVAYEVKDNQTDSSSFYVKAGYGTFKSPYFKALASLGSNERFTGNIGAHFDAATGKLPRQKYMQAGADINTVYHVNEQNDVTVYGGFRLHNTYRYGGVGKDVTNELLRPKLNYTDVFAGMGLKNNKTDTHGIGYSGNLEAHLFTDNNKGKDISVAFDFPLTKTFGDKLETSLALKGMINTFAGGGVSYNNHYISAPFSLKFQALEGFSIKAGLVPAFANKKTVVLPDIGMEYFLNDKNLLLQAGVTGYFLQQTYRGLANLNPWLYRPDSLRHSRVTEFYAGVKSSVNEQFSFRIKAGYGTLHHLPVYNPVGMYLDSFRVLISDKTDRLNISAGFDYHLANNLSWSTFLSLNKFGLTSGEPIAEGYLPMEIRSTALYQPFPKLKLQADVYAFNGASFYLKDGQSVKAKSAGDINLGAEYSVIPKVAVWLQLNNLLNNTYQRWNNYSVLGLQVQGGVVVRL